VYFHGSLIRISFIVHNKSNIKWRILMKKSLLILIACLPLFSCSPVQAETVTKNDVQLRNDVILNLLFPSIYTNLDALPKNYY
ncbi:hypothetical protein, partial [Peribacillus frigoritolerans]|uniref:hypothetical protein n=1 Tax=Peribacillus frigoritolerans TaxID=450367 RepID=UPI002E1F395E|nr:hypothetical protein [Peribacillus frigoritolerans]